MKILAFLFTILIAHNLEAQKSIFIRVYDLKGHTIARGHVLSATDTSVQLIREPTNILVRDIGSIRTKHSVGHNLLIGSAIGSSTMAIIGVASANPDEFLGYTAGEGALGGFIVGVPIGAAIGALTIAFKNSKHYVINGDLQKWKAFKSTIPGQKSAQGTSGP
ncbi:MAG TPA: hypothetical protein VEV83_03530 [Parafilimonas sp.]|nr:hypothetical protein [Parafilimonas sp.]